MKQKSKVRENSEYAKVPVFQWFFLLERLPLMDARAAINGIQEVSGSIPLISTKKRRNRLISALSDCQRSLAEFAPAGANIVQSIFAGGMYVGKNTSRLANVRA